MIFYFIEKWNWNFTDFFEGKNLPEFIDKVDKTAYDNLKHNEDFFYVGKIEVDTEEDSNTEEINEARREQQVEPTNQCRIYYYNIHWNEEEKKRLDSDGYVFDTEEDAITANSANEFLDL